MKRFFKITAIIVSVLVFVTAAAFGTIYAVTVSGVRFDASKLTSIGVALALTDENGEFIKGY